MAHNWYTIFMDNSGPKLSYWTDGTLRIDDLNPEVSIKWQVSRLELFKIGLRCIDAAMPWRF